MRYAVLPILLALAACGQTAGEPPVIGPLPALVTDNLPEGVPPSAVSTQSDCYIYAAPDGTTRRVTDPDGLPVCIL